LFTDPKVPDNALTLHFQDQDNCTKFHHWYGFCKIEKSLTNIE